MVRPFNIKDEFLQNVKYFLKKNNKTMSELEEYCGCSQGYFSRKKSKITIEDLFDIAYFLKVSKETLLDFDYGRRELIKEKEKEIEEIKKSMIKIN